MIVVRQAKRQRAALLLEVVVALTILVAAMGMLGAQLSGGLKITENARQQTRAAQLADRIMALIELDMQIAELLIDESQADGDFGEQFPGYFWRTLIETTEIEGLGLATIEILHNPDPESYDDIDGAKLIRRMHMLKAVPARIDLEVDFGLTEEQVTLLTESLPLADFDPQAVDPQALAAMDPEILLQMLPALMPLLQRFGAALPGQGAAGGAIPGIGDLNALLGGAGGAGGAGGGDPAQMEQIRNMIQQQLGGQIDPAALDALLRNAGSGAGGAPTPRAGGGGRGGFTIEDLNRLRNEGNRGRGSNR